ncbi:hypothetical protein [Mycobacterium sp. Marseille-P9652]|uniref:hypothetical protein n=1 Tax=Mycobacterium sp. Marseille-P9652 TaxID=2654950 RepID=UPI0012E89D48|nr:hypothetical protein [Mycobacterium sp. Marseille-P9652]
MTSAYELEPHELLLLENAARTADLIAALQARINADGPVFPIEMGGKTHPAVAEIRQQRITLARLLVALRVPTGDEDDRPAASQRRGIRGVYQLGA